MSTFRFTCFKSADALVDPLTGVLAPDRLPHTATGSSESPPAGPILTHDVNPKAIAATGKTYSHFMPGVKHSIPTT